MIYPIAPMARTSNPSMIC